MARLRKASTMPASPTSIETAGLRRPLKERTNTMRCKALAYVDDGDTEGLVKDGKTQRGQPRKSLHAQIDLRMAGGLGQADQRLTANDKLTRNAGAASKMTGSKRRPPRMTRQTVRKEAQDEVIGRSKKSTNATSLKKEVSRIGRASLLSAQQSDPFSRASAMTGQLVVLPDQPSGHEWLHSPRSPSEEVNVNTQRVALPPPLSVLRPHPTPMMDTSVLRHFKRRPRQPSMLTLVQQRTASAAPSPTHNGQGLDISDFDDGDGADEEEFAPDAEGTPLRSPGGGRGTAHTQRYESRAPAADTTVSSRKRRSTGWSDLSCAVEPGWTKRRRTDHRSSDEDDTDLPEVENTDLRPLDAGSLRRSLKANSDVQIINSSQSTQPPLARSIALVGDHDLVDEDVVIPSTEPQQASPPGAAADELSSGPLRDAVDDIMADPASSSSTSGLSPRPLADPEILTDPVTQASPPQVRKKAGRHKNAKPVTTATLQSLLPKRRQLSEPRPRASKHNFALRSEDEEETEVSEVTSSPPQSKRKHNARSTARSRPKSSATTRASKAAPESRRAPATSKQQVTKTYARTRATASDKENDDTFNEAEEGEDTTDLPEVSMHDVSESAELEAARRKFAEIDQWEMVFEEQSDEAHRSSSQQWR